MKKLLVLFLLVLTSLGTFFPCCVDDCTDSVSHQTSHEEKGTCSPFFACGTCAPAVEYQPITIFTNNIFTNIIIHQPRYLASLSEYTHSLFQPPRLC